ncbi:Radical SAM superfamily protein [Carboxydocella thermautotrophica]|nr:Radical SAM superfamily protein [Carboxydocella thermautotrophica]
MAKQHILPLFIPQLGCGQACSFCNQHTITGRVKPLLPEDLPGLLPAGPEPVELALYGGSFTALPLKVQVAWLESLQPWRQRGKISTIRLSTRPDAINLEQMLWLKSYGVTTVELGVQSLDDQVLARAGRRYRAADVITAILAGHVAGLKIGIQLLPGLPGETPQTAVAGARRLAAVAPDLVRIYPLVVLAGTPLARELEAGTFQPWDFALAVDTAARLKIIFQSRGIPVIRIGLQPGQDLVPGSSVLAGCYHPALGQIVDSRIFLWLLESLLQQGVDPNQPLFVNPRDFSNLRGQHGVNLCYLSRKFNIKPRILGDGSLPRGKIRWGDKLIDWSDEALVAKALGDSGV